MNCMWFMLLLRHIRQHPARQPPDKPEGPPGEESDPVYRRRSRRRHRLTGLFARNLYTATR